MAASNVLVLYNGASAAAESIPTLGIDEFRGAVIDGVERNGRLAAMMATPSEDGRIRLLAAVAHGSRGSLAVCGTVVDD